MFHNKEIKRFVFAEGLILCITFILILVFNNIIFLQYKNSLIDNNSKLIGSLLEKNPLLEEDIISSIIKNEGSEEVGRNVLSKYGLSEVDNLDYINMVSTMKTKITVYNLLFALLVFCMLSFIYFVFMKKQYRKIDQINQYLLNLLNGNYSLDIKDYEEGVISNLKNDIYRITVLLQNQSEIDKKAKKDLEDVLSDISHQLKTPLTSMYVISDLLLDDEMDPAIRKDFIYKNKLQLERIEWLVTSILKISRLDSGTIVLKEEEVHMHDLLEKAIEPIAIALELKKQRVEIKGNSSIKVKVDFNWTVEAFLNVLKNAHEHSPEESNIEIIYGENALYTYVDIKDHGEGIAEKDIRHIFKRFYKGQNNKESIGIGLNMAFMILNKENGDIIACSEKGKGTTFTIKFYKKVV